MKVHLFCPTDYTRNNGTYVSSNLVYNQISALKSLAFPEMIYRHTIIYRNKYAPNGNLNGGWITWSEGGMNVHDFSIDMIKGRPMGEIVKALKID